jgi:predicted DNA-binding transcriptional regulator AlpA
MYKIKKKGGLTMAVSTIKNFDELPVCMQMKDVAACLGVSTVTAYELARKKGFPAVKVSERRIICPRDRFLKWLDNSADAQIV